MNMKEQDKLDILRPFVLPFPSPTMPTPQLLHVQKPITSLQPRIV